jgi:long-chain fatty acid transport protein
MKSTRRWWLICLATLGPLSLYGLGIRIPDQDPLATARGNAFAATADNPAAIYYNPAGITQLDGQRVRIGAYSIWLNSRVEPSGGGSFNTKDKLQAVPEVYYTLSPAAVPLSFGLGLYMPYGLSVAWPDATPFRTAGVQGDLTYLTVNPVAAWRINSCLSIAAGPTVNYSQADLRYGIAVPGDQLRFKGDDTDLGFDVGLRWQPLTKHAFGLTYRSATTFNYGGTSHASPYLPPTDASARVPFPQTVIAGWSFRPTPAWNLEFDVDWTDWTRLKTVTLNQPAPAGPKALPFNWRSSFMYEWGATRYFKRGLHASAGYIYSENSVPDTDFTPLVPDSDRHILSLGIGRERGRLRWEAAYQFAYGPPRTVASTTNPSVNGRYRFLSHALAITVGYSF